MALIEDLKRVSPEEVGVSPSGILGFLEAVKNEKLDLHSFMFLRHGSVFAEGWWDPYSADKPHMLFSLSKSFTSTAVGMAVEEKLLSVEDSVISFFDDYVTSDIRANMGAMKIKHLLSMGTGHAEDTMPYLHQDPDGDWVRAFLNRPIEHEPGTFFLYNTGATYMLSAILQKVTGETLLSYLSPRLFDPLGIEGATWQTCPRGINTGGFGLKLKTEDIAKFGELYLREGSIGKRQIVPKAWVEEATSKQISNGDSPDSDWTQGYGYQFWRCRHGAYRGDGAFGQFCVVMPEQDAVIAITSGVSNLQGVLNAVWEHLLPAMTDEALHSEPSSQAADASQERRAELLAALRNLELATPALEARPTTDVARYAESAYEVAKNRLELDALQFTFDDSGFVCSFKGSKGEARFVGGYDEFVHGESQWPFNTGESTPVAVRGGWKADHILVVTICFVETPFALTLECTFTDGSVDVSVKQNVGFNAGEMNVVLHGVAR